MAGTWHLSYHKNKGKAPHQKEGRGRGVRADDERGFQPTTPKADPEGPRADTNLLKRGWQELKGGRSGCSAPRGGSRPALGERGRREGRRAGVRMGGGGGRRAAASGSAAARRNRDHAWPHPRYRYAQSLALSTPPMLATSRGWREGTRKYTLPAAHSATTSAPGGRRRRTQGRGIRAAAPRDEAGRPRCARRLCGRLTAEPAAHRPAPPAY